MVWVALAAALGWIVAALMAGLWHGERLARQKAESWATMGHPHGETTAEAVGGEGDDLQQAKKKQWEQDVTKIEASLKDDLREQGRLGNVSADRIRDEAERIAAQAFGSRG